jgi:hypothetical protein
MMHRLKLALVLVAVLGFATVAAADSVSISVLGVNPTGGGGSDVITNANSTAAQTALNTWAGSSTIVVLENFNGMGQCGGIAQGFCNNAVVTGAGTFTATSGLGGATDSNNHNLSPSILTNSTSPFDGRFDVTPGTINATGQWLDSNDVKVITWSVSGGLTNLFFFMTDVNDINGTLTITLSDGSITNQSIIGGHSNGTLYFVGITADSAINTITFNNTSNGDGWGIDYIGTTTSVPEPASMFLLGTGLLAGGRRLSKMIKK